MRESFVELGIIVKAVRHGDYDARLAVFTATGVKWLNVKGVYRPKAKFSAAIGLFTVAEFTHSGTTVTGINMLVAPYAIAADIHRYYLACAIADALFKLEFVEQTPQALVTAVEALTALSQTKTSCYVIFIDCFTALLKMLGYDLDITLDPEHLTLAEGKKFVKRIADAFVSNVDYQIQFCDMMY